MELRVNTPEKFRFPEFEIMQFYAARYYSRKLKRLNLASTKVSASLLADLAYLNQTLKRWLKSKKVN
jgi:hypothetical protein